MPQTDAHTPDSARHLTASRARAIVARTSFETSQTVLEPFVSLDLDAAKVLAALPKGGLLDLSGIRQATDPVAAALASYSGYLGLHSLKTLSLPAAQHLAKHKGGVYLGGLERVSDEVARLLLQCRDSDGGTNCFAGGRRIELSLQVARNRSWKRLKLGRRLTAAIAARICSEDIQPYSITGCFESLDKDAAEILVRKRLSYKRDVSALGLLTDDTDEFDEERLRTRLSKLLDLSGLRDLAADTAAVLMRFRDSIDLSGLANISEETAKAIGSKWLRDDWDEPLMLDGLRTLPAAVAKGLSGCRGPISLNGVETLSLEAARALLPCQRVDLHGLLYVDSSVLDVLARAKNISLTDEWAAKAKQMRAHRTVLPALRKAGFFKFCRTAGKTLGELVYPAPGVAGVYNALLADGRAAGVGRLFTADVEELLEQGPGWFFGQGMEHLGLDARAARGVRVDKGGTWIHGDARYPIAGGKIRHSSSARAEYAIVAILNRMLERRRRPDQAYGVDEGNAFGIAFLTPEMAKLIAKVADSHAAPRSVEKLKRRAEQSCNEGEPPVMIVDQ